MPDETLLQPLIFPTILLAGLMHGLLRRTATRLIPAFIGSMMLLAVLLIAAGISQEGDWVRWFGLTLIILPVAMLLLMIGHAMGLWLKGKVRAP